MEKVTKTSSITWFTSNKIKKLLELGQETII